MRKHAILAPSHSERWINCTRSAVLEAAEPHSSNDAADKGSLAHSLAEQLILQRLQSKGYYALSQAKLSAIVDEIYRIQADPLYDEEMLFYCHEYADYVIEQYEKALHIDILASIFLEVELYLSYYVPDSFGHADVVIISNVCIHTIDLKTGRNEVASEENKQAMLYTLGALHNYDFLFSPQKALITIYQPVINNTSTWETSRAYLLSWAAEVLKPAAKLAFKGEGEFKPGDHCRYCKIKPKCAANEKYNMQIAQLEFADPIILSDQEIAYVVSRSKLIIDWLKSVNDYATEQAIKHGKRWPGLKLVKGKSDRAYVDNTQVELRLLASKIKASVIYKPLELWGITEMEKRLGADKFKEYLSDLIVKPDSKPALAPESSNKAEYNSFEKAQREFTEELEDENPDNFI